MTVRRLIEKALHDLESEFGGSGAGIFELHRAIELLDTSREITAKLTDENFKVTSHKARVVLDD